MYAFLTSQDDERAKVLDVLSDEWPLNIKSLYSRVRRDDGLATYTRVSQAVRKLEKAGVLVENRRTYAISMDWLSRTKKKAEELTTKDIPKLGLNRAKKDGESHAVTFSCYAEALYSLLEDAQAEFRNTDHQKPIMSRWYRACPSIAIAREHFAPVKEFLTNRQHYVLVRGHSFLDRVLMDFWKEFGSHIQLGASCAESVNDAIVEDQIIQLFMPMRLRNLMDELYENTTPHSLNLAKLYEHVFSWQFPVTVVVTKDARLADQIRAETMAHFARG